MANFEKIFKEQTLSGENTHEIRFGFDKDQIKKYGFGSDFYSFGAEDAKKICFEQYWEPFGFQAIQNSKVASEVFEFTRHTGNGELSVKILQRAFNVLNKNILLREDGILGERTIASINTYKFYKSLFKTLNILHGMYYVYEAEGNDYALQNMLLHQTSSSNIVDKFFIRNWIDKIVK